MARFGARAYSPGDAQWLGEASFDFAEIDWKEPTVVRRQLPELARLRERYGLDYLAHGPNELDPSDLEEIVKGLGPTVCQLLELAPELDIRIYTQHLWLDSRFMGAEAIDCKVDLLAQWLDVANCAGVRLCIENLSEHADHFSPAFERLPGLGMTLDVGHGQILSEPNAGLGFIAHYPDRICHVHLHDNLGGTRVQDDLHLPIGQGRVDFPAILGALGEAGYDGGFCCEVRLADVMQCRDTIRKMWQAA